MMGSTDVSTFVAIGSVMAALAAGVTVVSFWMRFSDRITVADAKAVAADAKAASAMQEAAEAKNDADNLRDAMADLTRDHGDTIDRTRREQGESLTAIRQHVTELAMFVRDNFVRNAEFTSAMKDIRDGQKRLEDKLDRAIEHPRGHA